MRYPASEKLEIIRTVESSHLPTARQTIAKKSVVWGANRRSICCAFRTARFIGGTMFMSKVAWMRWRTNLPAPNLCETVFQTVLSDKLDVLLVGT